MNKIIVICLVFIAGGYLFAQTSKINREKILAKIYEERDIKITRVEPNILRLNYPDGKVKYENIGDYKSYSLNKITYSTSFDSTIIDLTTIDTTLYYQKYSYWQEVRVGSYQTAPPLVGDINNNNLSEIYGLIKDYNTDFSNNTVMEMNNVGSFDSVYSYDSTSLARSIYDIDKDGMDELFIHRFPPDTNYLGHSWLFFKKPSDTSLSIDLSFIFYPFPNPSQNQINNNTFGDWDGDAFTDQIFIRTCCPPTINIFEYNPTINNFDSVYQYDFSSLDNYFEGFSIRDFDQDGKTEFFAGSTNGSVISIENCGDNCYTLNWQGSVETNNAYLYAATNDLDGNGKPEVWIGGYHFQDGEAITRLTIFEASSNNNYVAVGKIDIIGAFNFYAKNIQVLDVDKDGKDEVMLCIEQHVIILKFKGSQNHHTYEVFYIKRNDLAFGGKNSVYYGATMYDVTNDGKEDIIIHMDDIISGTGMRLFTFIYKADFTVNVAQETQQPEQFYLYSNYPNPFNPSTKFNFDISEHSNVIIIVYNILGKEITTLLEKELSPGNYSINWDAKDSNGQLLPSGVYLIRFNAENSNTHYIQTIKSVLLK
jgi:hypothetical protein